MAEGSNTPEEVRPAEPVDNGKFEVVVVQPDDTYYALRDEASLVEPERLNKTLSKTPTLETTQLITRKNEQDPRNPHYLIRSSISTSMVNAKQQEHHGFYAPERVQTLCEALAAQGEKAQVMDYNQGRETALVVNRGDKAIVIDLGPKSRADGEDIRRDFIANVASKKDASWFEKRRAQEEKEIIQKHTSIGGHVEVNMIDASEPLKGLEGRRTSSLPGYSDSVLPSLQLGDRQTFIQGLNEYAQVYGKVLTAVYKEPGVKPPQSRKTTVEFKPPQTYQHVLS